MKTNVSFNKWRGDVMTIGFELLSVPVNHVHFSLYSAVAAFLSSPKNIQCCFEILMTADSDESTATGVKIRTFIILHMLANRGQFRFLQNKSTRFRNLLAQECYILEELGKDSLDDILSRVMTSPYKATSFPVCQASKQAWPAFIENACTQLLKGTTYSLTILKSSHNGYISNGLITASDSHLLTTAGNPLPLWNVWKCSKNSYTKYIPFRMETINRRDRKQDVLLSDCIIQRLLELPSGRTPAFSCSPPRCDSVSIPKSLMNKERGIMVGNISLPNGDLRPLFLHEKDFATHTVCIGQSGTGKTSLLENIMVGCHKAGLNLLILDVEGTDLRAIAPVIDGNIFTFNSDTSPYPINPFRIEGLQESETNDILEEVFTGCLDFGPTWAMFLKEALTEFFSQTPEESRSLETYRHVFNETFQQNKYSVDVHNDFSSGIDARLRDLSFLGGGNSVFEARELLQKSTILELQAVNYTRDRLFILAFILSVIFRIKRKDHEMGRDNQPLLVVLDEAHVVLSKESQKTSDYFINLIQRIIREGRKYGLWLIISDQNAKLMGEIVKNVGLKIIMRSEMETAMLAHSLQTPSAEEHLPILQVGEAFLRVGDMAGAVFISSPSPIACKKMDNQSIGEYMHRRGAYKAPVEMMQYDPKVFKIANMVIDWLLLTYANKETSLKDYFSLEALLKNIFPNETQLLPQLARYFEERYNGRPSVSFLWKLPKRQNDSES